MKLKLLGMIAIIGLVMTAAPVLADWDPNDPVNPTNHKMHYPQMPNPCGWDVKAGTYEVPGTVPVAGTKVLADDFLCTGSGPILDIHFWGSWRSDDVGQITNLHLSLHSDIPDPDGDGPLFSMPGEQLWEYNTADIVVREMAEPAWQGWYDPNTGLYIPWDHNRYFQYNVFIPRAEAFVQKEGTIYWLDITVVAEGGEWGWKTSVDHWNDDAVFADIVTDGLGSSVTPWQELFDPCSGESLDLAFVITPEPGTLILLALGGLALLRRRY